jgi:hypothetical protein
MRQPLSSIQNKLTKVKQLYSPLQNTSFKPNQRGTSNEVQELLPEKACQEV